MATILVVDDEQKICDVLRAVLSRHGHDVLTANTGRPALDLFRQRRPQITLLDLRMPDMDGIEVLRQIRAVDPKASVVMLTEASVDALERQARALGVTDFLKKGVSFETLVNDLDEVMKQQGQGATGKSKTGNLILVVDDEPMLRGLLSQFLTIRGYRVRTAKNGPEALAQVQQEQPRMVILDLYMPGMNGVEVLRQLRAQDYKGGAIALTASQDEQLLQETLDLGLVDVMGKPVDLERLALVIQVGLALTDRRRFSRKTTP
ncbi:MAG: response regulator [Nitrospirae bacterium]|nr:response regulator [Nitrospirota bacterium]